MLTCTALPLNSSNYISSDSQQQPTQDQNKPGKFSEDDDAKPPVNSDDVVDENSFDIIDMAEVDSPSAQLSTTSAHSTPQTAQSEDCVICMDRIDSTDPTRRTQLDCGHVFCTECIAECFKKCQPRCPSCSKVFGVLRGNQPKGTFQSREVASRLPGYDQFGTIEIIYSFPSGVQTVS